MVKIKATNQALLAPLQHVTGIVERRHTLPILSNVLIQVHAGTVDFVATDLEVQITAKASLDGSGAEGAVTVAARKLYDILRSLPEDAEVALDAKDNRMVVRAGKSRFNLQTLAPPTSRACRSSHAARTLAAPEAQGRAGARAVALAADIRHSERRLFSIEKNMLRVVATDGHRLTFAAEALAGEHESVEAILPRKTVLELISCWATRRPCDARDRSNQVRFSGGSRSSPRSSRASSPTT
jgi:DNA polymerase-3 subunit beta